MTDASDALSIDLVLVPIDGSEEADRAAEYAVAVAAEYSAELHVVYVVGEQVGRAIETGTIDEADVAAESQSSTDAVAELAADAGVECCVSAAYGFSTRVLSQHPGSVILDTAEDVDADFIVVPRESMETDAGDVLEKAAEYVLLYASQPVLSV